MKCSAAFAYALVFLLTQALVAPGCAWLASTEWFLTHDGLPTMPAVGYLSRLPADRRCDIVIIGDSTAQSDFVPAVLQARTGLTACNLAEIRVVGRFVGEHHVLDTYLESHSPPRYLIAGFTPRGMDVEHPPLDEIGAVSIQYAVDYDRGPWLWHFMITHPARVLEWDGWVEHAMLKQLEDVVTRKQETMWRVDQRALRDSNDGVWRAPAPNQTSCFTAAPPNHLPSYAADQAEVAAFRKRYLSSATTVLFYATPVASCDQFLAEYKADVGTLPDAPLEVHPIGDFMDINIHLGADAAARFSAEVGDHIAALEQQRKTTQEQQTPR